jgi:hypothetical protein
MSIYRNLDNSGDFHKIQQKMLERRQLEKSRRHSFPVKKRSSTPYYRPKSTVVESIPITKQQKLNNLHSYLNRLEQLQDQWIANGSDKSNIDERQHVSQEIAKLEKTGGKRKRTSKKKRSKKRRSTRKIIRRNGI